MALTIRSEDGITILTPSGMLLGGKETDELQDKVSELDKAGDRMLILDMGKTTFMTSIAIAAVVRAYVSYSKRGARVKICALDRKIRQIFVIAKLTMAFGDDMHETVEEGVASFRKVQRSTGAGTDSVAGRPAEPATESAAARHRTSVAAL